MAFLKWEDRYSVKVPEMDRQHQHMVGIINRLHDEMTHGAPPEALAAILKDLIRYTQVHFRREEELMAEAKTLQAPYDLVVEVARSGKLPVPNFSAGGCATPADAALMMQLGAEAVFVGSGIFKAAAGEQDLQRRRELTLRRAKAIVAAVTYYDDPKMLAEVSTDLGEPMSGLDVRRLEPAERLRPRRASGIRTACASRPPPPRWPSRPSRSPPSRSRPRPPSPTTSRSSSRASRRPRRPIPRWC